MDNTLLNVAETAKILRCGKAAIYDLIHDKKRKFPCIKIGKNFRIPSNGLESWIENQYNYNE